MAKKPTKKVVKVAPKPVPKRTPPKRIAAVSRNKGTAVVGTTGSTTGGAAFAAFFLVLPWVGIFASAAQRAGAV